MTETELDAYDASWRRENLDILARAQDRARDATSLEQQMLATFLFGRFAECEQVRLKCRHAVLLRRERSEA